MKTVLSALLLALPVASFAAGSGSDSPPKPTDTTQTCTDGKVYDADAKECVAPQDSRLDDADRLRAVREFAYAGQLNNAGQALDSMKDQQADMVLTYRGFIARRNGDLAAAESWYRAALKANPDNLLARSYMGQGFAARGDLAAAQVQLAQIRLRGDAQGWPARALEQAMKTGVGYSY